MAHARRLLAAAKDGRSNDAESVLRDMHMAGLQPGGRAYHGLICAYCKAGDSQGALTAVRRAVQEGTQCMDFPKTAACVGAGYYKTGIKDMRDAVSLRCRNPAHSRDLSCADARNDAGR